MQETTEVTTQPALSAHFTRGKSQAITDEGDATFRASTDKGDVIMRNGRADKKAFPVLELTTPEGRAVRMPTPRLYMAGGDASAIGGIVLHITATELEPEPVKPEDETEANGDVGGAAAQFDFLCTVGDVDGIARLIRGNALDNDRKMTIDQSKAAADAALSRWDARQS